MAEAPVTPGVVAAWRAQMDRRYFRYLRYFFYTLRSDFIEGTPEKRRYFIGRLRDAASKTLHVDCVLYALFALRLKLLDRHNWLHRHWLWAINGLEIRDRLAGWTKDVSPSRPVRIVIFGAGGIGDLIQTTPILVAMRTKLPDAEIVFLHRSPAVKSVLGDNQNIDAACFASFNDAAKLRVAIARDGIADFLLELESGTYVGVYTLAPTPLRSVKLAEAMPDSFFDNAAKALQLRRAKPNFLRADGTYHWPSEWQNMSFLDTLGATTGLAVDRHSPFTFQLSDKDIAFAAGIGEGKKIITVQNGVDDAVVKWMHVTGRYASKLMPLAIWRDTVRLLLEKGYYVVQLGASDDEAISGVSLDMRGKTSLQQAGAILKQAICHVGTEGGLIHLARAVETRSVVLFGPTSSAFFGYNENSNLTASSCNSCWQTTPDWYIYCPRGFFQAPCMQGHTAETIVNSIKVLSK